MTTTRQNAIRGRVNPGIAYGTTESFTSSDTLTVAESGKVCNNSGASATVTLTAPAGAANLRYTLDRVAAYAMRFAPNGSQTILDGGAGKYVELQSKGRLTFEWNGTQWVIVEDTCTWNYEP